MGDLFKSKKHEVEKRTSADTTNTRSIGGGAQPLLDSSLAGIARTAGAGPTIGDFPGADPLQTEALGGIANLARTGTGLPGTALSTNINNLGFQNPFQNQIGQLGTQAGFQGSDALARIAGGGFGANPFTNQAMEAAINPLIRGFQHQLAPGLLGALSGAGRLRGGDASAGQAIGDLTSTFGEGVGRASLPFLFQDIDSSRQAQLAAAQAQFQGGAGLLGAGAQTAQGAAGVTNQALGLAPSIQGLQFDELNRLFGAGEANRGFEMDRFNAENQLSTQDFMRQMQAGQFASGVGSQFGTTTGTSTGTESQDKFSKPIGMDLLGAGLSLAALPVGGPAAAVAGSVGGNLLNSFL